MKNKLWSKVGLDYMDLTLDSQETAAKKFG